MSWCALCTVSLLALTACGGGGGGDAPPAQPTPDTALIWGSGTWGGYRWSASTAPARVETKAAASSSSSLTESNTLTLETSR